MVYIHGGFLVFGSNGAEQASGRAPVNWMKARPSGQLASGEFPGGGASSNKWPWPLEWAL